MQKQLLLCSFIFITFCTTSNNSANPLLADILPIDMVITILKNNENASPAITMPLIERTLERIDWQALELKEEITASNQELMCNIVSLQEKGPRWIIEATAELADQEEYLLSEVDQQAIQQRTELELLREHYASQSTDISSQKRSC